MKELSTYQDLLAALQELSPEQLAQPVQVATCNGNCAKPVELQPAIALGTVAQMEFFRARSSVDNKYHAEEVVVLFDANPYGEDGAVAYTLGDDGDVSETLYGKDGPTSLADQTGGPKPDYVLDE